MRDAVITACLAVLVREAHAAGVNRSAVMKVLRNAPDQIDAAMTRGSRALVIYRLDAENPAGIVSDNDSRLERFTTAAESDGAPLVGLNPHLIARMAAGLGNFAIPKQQGAAHVAPTVH